MPPEVEEPVEPLVPELLPVPADPPLEGVVAVELPEAPMPDDVPEEDVPLGRACTEDPLGDDVADAEPDGVESEPVAEPPVDPMPDAVPEALPDAVVPHAARAAVQIRGSRILIMCTP